MRSNSWTTSAASLYLLMIRRLSAQKRWNFWITTRHGMRKRAYLYARDMVWSRVAQKYMKSFERSYNEQLRNPRATFSAQNTEKKLDRLPPVKLDHLNRMTDHTGMVEHAVFAVPNYPEGYTTDDNARALIVAILLEEWGAGAPP